MHEHGHRGDGRVCHSIPHRRLLSPRECCIDRSTAQESRALACHGDRGLHHVKLAQGRDMRLICKTIAGK